ncbi:MAG: VanW family protein [Lachnospiraceae bacterium]|nr:VanW family protein [Lachnospiraceae bacterium]
MMDPLIKKVLIGLVAATAVFGLVCGGVYLKKQLDIRTEAAQLEERIRTVEEYQEVSYGNKKLADVDLSGMTEEDIAGKLQEELSDYQKRKVTLTVNGNDHTYSMKKLKEVFFYQGSDGRRFAAGKEQKLAEYIVSMDKDLEMEEQYQIISGEKDAAEYTVSIQSKSNKKCLEQVIGKLGDKYDIPVKNSHIKKNGGITGTAPGRVLKTKAMKKDLQQYLKDATKEDYEASYETQVVEPTWFPKDLRKVNTVISSFTTSFISTTSRGHNIQVGASRINGICLLPGEKASFDEIVHDGSDGQQFQEAGSYLNGETVQTKGGGICQISTTAYNALLRAGILPSKRYPHSMPVHYVPLGLDAAISEGVKDLEVTNTLDVPIVIKMFTRGNSLTTQILSYKGALKGRSYQPRAVQLSSTRAKAYLDTYKKGKKISSLLLHTDSYIPG